MKKIRSLLFFAFAAVLLSGFSNTEKTANGIAFFKGDFAEALHESQKTGKPIFMDVYASWCGPCQKLKRESFKDKKVAAYYNKNFINISVDGETPEGKNIRQIYAVDSYPTLLIVDATGKQLARTEGFMKPYILINFGRRVIP